MKALEETPIEERDQSTICMAINTEQIPEVKERIKKFRRELDAYLVEADSKDRVYHLSISFYPVSLK